MVTKDFLKAEIDKIPERYLDILYRIMRALMPANRLATSEMSASDESWQKFINQTYGNLADDPLTRADQGRLEAREKIE
ncbi:MAG: hypothetical protein AAF629_31345 [Chloroflexota bacterium]